MRRIAVAVSLVSLLAATGEAQGFPASQRQTITQNVALTKFEVTYGRPVARGRDLWGKLVPYDEVWHPGADKATRLKIDHDITVEGKTLKAGEYSLWLIARADKPWTVIFNGAYDTWHRPYVGEATEVLRVDVAPETVTHVESLTIDFPMVMVDDATLRIHWGTQAVTMKLKAPFR